MCLLFSRGWLRSAGVGAGVTTAAWAELGTPVGGRLWAQVKATQVRVVPLA